MRKAFESRKITKTLYGLIGGLGFLGQITAKDRAQYTGKTLAQKVQLTINIVSGRVFGFRAFATQTAFPQTINTNLDSYWNSYTKTGAAGVAYSIIGGIASKWTHGKVRFPMRAKIGRAAGSLLGGAILGTLFDDPVSQNQFNYATLYNNSSGSITPMFKGTTYA